MCTPEIRNGMAVGKRDDKPSIHKRATWAMYCPGRGAGKMIHGADRWCCEGWMPVMGICTSKKILVEIMLTFDKFNRAC